MDIQWILVVGLVVIFGGALQSAAGFGFGIFAIPLLILLGMAPYEAIAAISVCGGVQTLVGLYSLRREIQWRLVILVTCLAGVMVPIGVWTLELIILHISEGRIRQIFGFIILGAVAIQWFGHVQPRDRLHWGWMAGVFPLSGFMCGVSGMGGPPVVMWVMAHTWSSRRSRAMIWAYFTALTPISQLFLYREFGMEAVKAAGVGLAVSPIMLLGVIPGLRLGRKISKPALRITSYVILLMLSIYAICQPLRMS